MYYTGIGARKTPWGVQLVMTRAAIKFNELGWTLRSGAADGADTAFEKGAGDNKEIYLPWPGFNKREEGYSEVGADALAIAESVHPAWAYLRSPVRRLHGRNAYQILGPELNSPSAGLICWTEDGAYSEEMCSKSTGGTGTGIKIASRHDIPILNLRHVEHYQILAAWLDQNEVTLPWLINKELKS